MRFVIYLLLLIFGTNCLAIAQGQSLDMEDMLAKLKHPANIKTEIVRRQLEINERPEVLAKAFEPGERLYFRILLTNTSMQPIAVIVSDRYFQNRPKLFKDGQEIVYRESTAKLIKAKEKERIFNRNYPVSLFPSVPTEIGYLDLSDWYAPLESGHYELTSGYRFVPDGDWLESPPITFEIRSKKQRQ